MGKQTPILRQSDNVPRIVITVIVPVDLRDRAKEHGINISRFLERCLRDELKGDI